MGAGPLYQVSPEVAGGLGPNTIMDRAQSPPKVERLHYVFVGWLGGEIVESYPSFLVSERIANAIRLAGLSGVSFGEVEVSIDPQFQLFDPKIVGSMPGWVWLQPDGSIGVDDFWVDEVAQLGVSSRAYELLSRFDVASAEFQPISN